jgi:Putative prokaryotic signal transducing protein
MADEMVTLATFSNPIEAQLAKGRLEEAGIPAFLLGDLGGGMFVGMSNLFGEIRLTVAAEDVEEAARVLEADEDDEVVEDEDSTAIKGERPRQESSTEVRAAVESPLQDRTAPPNSPPSDSPVLVPEEEMFSEDEDEPEERTVRWTADDVATRAFRAAIFGFFCPVGLLHLYALWLVIRLPSAEGELSSAGSRKAIAAFALAILPGAIAALLLLGMATALIGALFR